MNKFSFDEIMDQLEKSGTEQNRKVFKRHGCGDNLFGVSFKDLRSLKKKIKVDQELAEKLWDTGNHDARVLATMIADEKAISAENIEKWLNGLDNYVIVDSFAKELMSKHKDKLGFVSRWCPMSAEWIGRAGYTLLALIAMEKNNLEDGYFIEHLKTIVEGIKDAPNRKKEAMNNALIAIGLRNHHLREKAEHGAQKIGKVIIDHGNTSCKTFIAQDYIKKGWAHKEKMKNKAH